MNRKTLAERFWSKVEKHPNGCWHWMGAVNQQGTGVVLVYTPQGKVSTQSAQRVAFELITGRPREGKIYHACGVTTCVNPDHFTLENQNRGENCNLSKLTEAQVREIRKLSKEGMSAQAICHYLLQEYGVSMVHANVYRIVTRSSWKHVSDQPVNTIPDVMKNPG